jgi:hypothetical protein
MTYTFNEARKIRDELDAIMTDATKVLNTFPRGAMGLTPDAVKHSVEFKAAKRRYDDAFIKQRAINVYLMSNFKQELRDERDAKRAAKILLNTTIKL